MGAASLAAGPDGVWFTDPAANRVGEVDYSGHVVEFGAASPDDASDSSLAIGPDGDAYYVVDGSSTPVIVKVSPDGAMTPIAVPGYVGSSLLAGPDGVDFWLGAADGSSARFERLKPDGTLATVLTTTSLPRSFGDSLAFGPDGNLWSTEGNVIGRVVLAPTPVPEPGPTLVVGSPDPVDPFEGGPRLSALVAPAGESATLDLAVFRHSADVSGVSATIDWGDGSATTAGTLGPPDLEFSNDPFFVDGQVSGSHAYAQAGDYTVTVTVDATGPGGPMSASIVETVAAVDPTPSPESPPLVLQAGRSIAFQGAVAEFTTPTPHDASASDFTATIDWGDGSPPTSGTVASGFPGSFYGISPTGPANLFYASGGHTYATAGTFDVAVTLTDQFGHSSTESTPIQVVAGPLAVTGVIAPPIGPTQDASVSFQGSLTDFQGTVAGRTYSATIDWGDGSPPTDVPVGPFGSLPGGGSTGPATFGIPSLPGGGSTGPATFNIVAGSHAYTQAGDYTARVSVADNQGDSAELTTTFQASAAPAFGLNLSYGMGGAAAGDPIPVMPLASITTLAAGASASDFTATVDWGDGSAPTAGTVVADDPDPIQPGRTFTVSGGHTYATPGFYNQTITVDGPDGSTSVVTTTITVSLASRPTDGTAADTTGALQPREWRARRSPWRPSPPVPSPRRRPTSGRRSTGATARPPRRRRSSSRPPSGIGRLRVRIPRRRRPRLRPARHVHGDRHRRRRRRPARRLLRRGARLGPALARNRRQPTPPDDHPLSSTSTSPHAPGHAAAGAAPHDGPLVPHLEVRPARHEAPQAGPAPQGRQASGEEVDAPGPPPRRAEARSRRPVEAASCRPGEDVAYAQAAVDPVTVTAIEDDRLPT